MLQRRRTTHLGSEMSPDMARRQRGAGLIGSAWRGRLLFAAGLALPKSFRSPAPSGLSAAVAWRSLTSARGCPHDHL